MGSGRTRTRGVSRAVRGDELYEMTVLPDGGRWYWAVTRSSRSTAGWHLGVLHAGGEAGSEQDAWLRARRAVPRQSRRGSGPETLFLSLKR